VFIFEGIFKKMKSSSSLYFEEKFKQNLYILHWELYFATMKFKCSVHIDPSGKIWQRNCAMPYLPLHKKKRNTLKNCKLMDDFFCTKWMKMYIHQAILY
jgi:hypothetical protein